MELSARIRKEVRKAQRDERFCRGTGEEVIRRQHIAGVEHDQDTGIVRHYCLLCDFTFDISASRYDDELF